MRNIHFQIYIDTGGTFTDCIGIDQDGKKYRRKVLSNGTLRGKVERILTPTRLIINESWKLGKDILRGFTLSLLNQPDIHYRIQSYNTTTHTLCLDRPIEIDQSIEGYNFEISSFEEAPVLGIRLITQTALHETFPDLILKLGSTKGTNALLEHKGAKTLFLVTKGFKDLLKIGNQTRPDIFAMNVIKRNQLTNHVIEIDERIDAKGNILHPINLKQLSDQLDTISCDTIESVAIAFMNSYINPKHEAIVKTEIIKRGFRYISSSAELTPLIKLLPRAETTVVNAYLSPIIHDYIKNISGKIQNQSFQIMTSSGGLVAANNFYPKDSLLSGPAGGVVGASIIGKQSNHNLLITFDMGGTSTDVSRYSGDFDYRFELNVGDSTINSSAIAIETVAAGGGSICAFDGYKLVVGPESAGAFPGPACYGAKGPLTITDVNLLLGRINTKQFGIPIFKKEAENKLEELLEFMKLKTGEKPAPQKVLLAFIEIANEIMAGAIRKISISKGYDPKDFSLVAYGGAGGLHACDIAEMLNIKTILLPHDAGLLSAYGIGKALIERFAEKQILKNLDLVNQQLPQLFSSIETKAINQLVEEGFSPKQINIRQHLLFLRFAGQDNSLEIAYSPTADINALFQEQYLKLYGHQISNRPIEIETIRVIASLRPEKSQTIQTTAKGYIPSSEKQNNKNAIPVYIREKLNSGAQIQGQALLLDHYSTTYIKENWSLELDERGTAIVVQNENSSKKNNETTEAGELELYANRFMSIAVNMGALLQRTALSLNIKERLDFSCALLDADGGLVANAPHIPVHLGGLGVCVQTLLKHFEFEEGDTIVTNHPKYGGSHLPDVTVVKPIFHEGKRIAFVVNRAHHSEIGGISPGSMPPDANNLEEEGVVIAPFYLFKRGKSNWNGIKDILQNGSYPTRSIDENMADLNAAIAANNSGQEALFDLIKQHGESTISNYFSRLKQHAAIQMTETLSLFPNGSYAATEYLDNGSPLKVCITLLNGQCTIDFAGSSPVNSGNMNATKAIVYSVIIYVLRMLLKKPIPLNDGLLEPVTVKLPHGLLHPKFYDDPSKCPAVVGGNVEVSMRLTDTLLKAFCVMAASQGTMNNTLFGNDHFGYYETLCGGCGAGNGFHGADASHHHMTNTRITDPEIMEHRYPVRIDEFSIRKGSGGCGQWNGGNGVVRKLTFLESVNLSVLSQRRKSGPYGILGGENGKPGHQHIIKKNGEVIHLESIQNIDVEKGDSFVIATPGGGGYGKGDS